MDKSAPSFGRIAAMVVFALSCFGLLLFLWLAFGGADPAQAEGLPLPGVASPRPRSWPRRPTCASPACRSARSRRSSPTRRPAARSRSSRWSRATRRCRRTPRRSCARRRCWARPTSSSRRARRDAKPIPENGTLAAGAGRPTTVELDEILRAFDPKTRQAFQTWMQAQAQGIDGYGRDVNDALGNLAPVRRGHRDARGHPQPPGGRGQRLISNSGVVFGALTERQGQLRSLIQNSNRVFATTAARDRELQETLRRAADLRGRVARDGRAAWRSSRATPTRWSPSCGPAARELSPTLHRPQRCSRPDLKRLFVELNPLIDASQDRASRPPSGCSRDAAPAARPGRPGRAAARAAAGLPRALQAGADRVLRQHRGRHAGQVARRRACTTCARRTRSTPRTSRSIRAGSAPTGRTRTRSPAVPTSSAAASRSTRTATAAARSRASATTPAAAAGRADAAACPPLPAAGPRPDRRADAAARRTEQLQALVPNELLDRINKFAFANAAGRRGAGAAVQEAGPVHLRRRDDAVPAREGRHRRGSPAIVNVAARHSSGSSRASARRPGARAGRRGGCWRRSCAALALALRAERGHRHARRAARATSYEATERYRERFGEQSVVVLVRGDVANLVLTKNLDALVGLEGCLSGNKPADARRAGRRAVAVRGAGARRKPVQVVYGPGTFINSAVGEIQEQLQARSQATAAQAERAGARRRARSRAAQGRSKAEQDKAAEAARAGRLRPAAAATCCRSTCATGSG